MRFHHRWRPVCNASRQALQKLQQSGCLPCRCCTAAAVVAGCSMHRRLPEVRLCVQAMRADCIVVASHQRTKQMSRIGSERITLNRGGLAAVRVRGHVAGCCRRAQCWLSVRSSSIMQHQRQPAPPAPPPSPPAWGNPGSPRGRASRRCRGPTCSRGETRDGDPAVRTYR